jgi:hypothetical protein
MATDTSNGGKSDGVITAQNDGKRSRGKEVGYALRNLIKGFLIVGRNGEDIADITEGDLFSQVYTQFEVIRSVEGRDAADTLGTEASPRTVGGARVMGNADDRHIVFPNPTHIFQIGSFQESVNTSKVGKLAAGKGGNGAIANTGCCF